MTMEPMSLIARVFMATGATVFLVLTIQHETGWRRRLKHGRMITGRVVRIVEEIEIPTQSGKTTKDGDGPWPEIEIEHRGSTKTFISEYSGVFMPKIGSSVRVVINPDTGDAEHISWANRWLIPLGVIPLCLTFYLIAIFMGPAE